MTPVGFGDISGDPTSCPPAAFPRHLNISPLPHPTASDTHCIGACLSSQPRHPHITVSLLVSSRSFYPLPPLCSPSCLHHQLIGNLPSPLDRVSNFLFCVCLKSSLFSFPFYCGIPGVNQSKEQSGICLCLVGAASFFGMSCYASCRVVGDEQWSATCEFVILYILWQTLLGPHDYVHLCTPL